MTHYVFLGGLYPKEQEKELFKLCKGRLSFAANKHQWNMVEGLEENIGSPVTLINTFFIPPFPACKKKVFQTEFWSHADTAEDINIGFLNVRWIRNICQENGVYRTLKSLLQKNKEDKTVVFVYTMRFCLMKAIVRLKKAGFDFHVCLIVPDVPSVLMNYGGRKSLLQQITARYNLSHVNRYTEQMDSFVLLSEPMTELVDIGNRPYCIVDGLCNSEMIANLSCASEETSNKKRIVYTGSLHREYGICDLLEAFRCLSGDDYQLIVAGAGNAVEDVWDACHADGRITYLGTLRAEDVRSLQASATILINPRPIDGLDAKYSFPSKTIEYMLAGKPVVMNRLPGMDIAYEKYVFTPQKCGCQGLGETIEYVCSLPQEDIERITKAARQFVVDEKNSAVQMKRVMDMVSDSTSLFEV